LKTHHRHPLYNLSISCIIILFKRLYPVDQTTPNKNNILHGSISGLPKQLQFTTNRNNLKVNKVFTLCKQLLTILLVFNKFTNILTRREEIMAITTAQPARFISQCISTDELWKCTCSKVWVPYC